MKRRLLDGLWTLLALVLLFDGLARDRARERAFMEGYTQALVDVAGGDRELERRLLEGR